ncbi:MAG: TrkH family potassium uptake protein [Rhodospirillales bacterium]
MDFRPIAHVFGLVVMALGALGLLPAVADWVDEGPDALIFLACAALTLFFGGALSISTYQPGIKLSLPQAFVLTPLCWFGLPVFAALPLLWGHQSLGWADAYFEAVSGLTTTGSTILTGLDGMPQGLLLWRGLLQWMGGLGVIMIAIAILPLLKVGGMQLMRTESSDRSDKVLPRASQLAGAIGFIYVSLTVICQIAYWASGMTLFDALVHGMTTVATGGFSTSDLSMGAFNAPAQWICVLFMIAGSLPFVLMVRALYGRPSALWRDSQVRAFVAILGFLTLFVGCLLWWQELFPDLEVSLRTAALNITSIATTTGYASGDFQLWGAAAAPFFLFLMMLGGCTGSTTGSLKVFRWQILAQEVRRQITQAVEPKRIVSRRYNRKPLPADVAQSVCVYLFIVLALIGLGAAALASTGVSFVTALSGAVTSITNVGPGLGPDIGPASTFASLPDTAKWISALLMVLGRLEILTVLVLFDPRFWSR